MFENFKSDIIYYNTQADFELEFNLCGCCRKMRLLHDKCSDKKTLLLSLSRAVSRSRIIIITAPLFSNDKIISTVASAIGSSVEIIDNSAYNIASDAEIAVIKNSVPLVTGDGIFGGCIIESGPQTLILITDNKSIRKAIMSNLIHPYIMDFVGETDTNSKEEEAPLDKTEEILLETEEEPYGEESEDDEKDIDGEFILETEEDPLEEAIDGEEEFENLILQTEAESDEENLSTETAETYEHNNLIIDMAAEDDSDQEYDISENENNLRFPDIVMDNNEEPYQYNNIFSEEDDENPSPISIWLIIISVILLITLAILCYCIFYVPTKSGIEPATYLKDIFDTMFG